MRRIKHIFITASLLVLIPAAASAQQKITALPDTVKTAFFNGIAVRADIVGPIMLATGDCGHYEAGVRINIKDKYFPAFEIGRTEADQTMNYVEQHWYKTKAPYFRLGCDFNILRDKHDIYKAFAGFRYGFTSYKYDASVAHTTIIEDDPDTETNEKSTQTTYIGHYGLKGSSHWIEGVFGVDAKIWGPLHMGWDIRYRKKIKHSYSETSEPWYVPGFGGYKDAKFTFNFNIAIAI